METPRWRLQGHIATLEQDGLGGDIDVRRPDLGLQGLRLGRELYPSVQILKVRVPRANTLDGASVIDCYARGADLVATYAESADHPVRTQIYWRAHQTGNPARIGALELVVSVQTHLLDSDPLLTIESCLPADGVLRLADPQTATFEPLALPARLSKGPEQPALGCVILRLSGQEWSYVEMVHPADFQSSELTAGSDGRAGITHRLFTQRLEKGVILRARIAGHFVPRADDAALAASCYQTFSQSEPPLTT